MAAAINAAGLALADAAVPMYDIITACSLAVIEDKVFVDPTGAEEHLAMDPAQRGNNNGVITISMLPELKQISDFRQIGSMDIDCIMKAMELLQIECKKILPNIQQILVLNVVKSFEQQKSLAKEAKEREVALNAKLEEWKVLLNAG